MKETGPLPLAEAEERTFLLPATCPCIRYSTRVGECRARE